MADIVRLKNENGDWIEISGSGGAGTPGPAGPAGPAGSTGTTGPAGVGVPAGGTTGQMLVKNSNADYDTEWADPPAGGSGTSASVWLGG